MKIKTSELTGAALDWAVATCEGRKPGPYKGIIRATAHPDFPSSPQMFGPELNYSTDWSQGGPIIEREEIATHKKTGTDYWVAVSTTKIETGPTPLIAAMRCYVASKLGDTVEIPNELTK